MNSVTIMMINEFHLKKLGMDFMGYRFNKNGCSFHHLIVPKRSCKQLGLGDGYLFWNGAILMQTKGNSSHDYLHVIEHYDYDRFLAITSEIVEQNLLGKLDMNCLKNIHDILTSFEKEYKGKRTKKGYPIIREEFTSKRLSLK